MSTSSIAPRLDTTMRIRPTAAIITPYGLFNYGNRLQNCAVSQLLGEHGFDSTTLVLRPDFYKGLARDAAYHVGHMARLRGEASARYRNFHAFDRPLSKTPVFSRRHLESLGRKFDAFIIGSDQIWNPNQVDFGGAEFASMAPSHRIVSLSASIGLEEIPADRRDELARNLQRIPRISVREESGAEIVEELTGRPAETLIDPTLVATADQWMERAESRMVPQGDYVVFYLLGSYTVEQRRRIEDIDIAHQGQHIVLYDRNDRRYYEAGPQDFLGLLQGARGVVTDSYHAVAFALQFGVPCAHVNRQGMTYSMGSRFKTLSLKLGVKFRTLEAVDFVQEVEVQEDVLASSLASERQRFHKFLGDSLTDIVEGR